MSKRRKSEEPYQHPGGQGKQLADCGVPGCGVTQDTRFMDRVLVVVDGPRGPQCSTPLGCKRHAKAFAGAIPALRLLLEAAYEGREMYAVATPHAAGAPGEPGL